MLRELVLQAVGLVLRRLVLADECYDFSRGMENHSVVVRDPDMLGRHPENKGLAPYGGALLQREGQREQEHLCALV